MQNGPLGTMNAPNSIPTSYGTDGISPPVLPVASSQLQIIFEWAGLLPLAIYLAGNGLSYRLVGQTALAGFIGVTMFPRLGTLDSIAAFLHEGADYLDRASSFSELRRTVWDANWGSTFPCANGAASDIITRHAIRTARGIEIPENLAELIADKGSKAKTATKEQAEDSTHTCIDKTGAGDVPFRRYQTLYILDFTIDAEKRKANKLRRSTTWMSIIIEALFMLVLLGASAISILFGLYGTAVAIIISAVFRMSRLYIKVVYSPGYLENNESNHEDSCMLVAIHENASTWYLYTGSRAVVDGLLNKPMILDITARPASFMLAATLRSLAILQLVTMTYVAAQKGWDGVSLLVLITVAWTLDQFLYNDHRLAEMWLRRECVAVKAWKSQFSGRTVMLGTIQLLKSTTISSWMDQILAPSDRRETWLKMLQSDSTTVDRITSDPNQLSTKEGQSDQLWVRNNLLLTHAAANAIKTSMDKGIA